MYFTARICCTDGESLSAPCSVCKIDGVTAVSLSFHRDGISVDPERGAVISIPLTGVTRYMANRRHSEFWCSPFFGDGDFSVMPTETQLLLCEQSDGRWICCVPVVSEDYKCILEGTPDGLCAVMYSWCRDLDTVSGLAFVMAEGDDPFELVHRSVTAALKLLNNGTSPRSQRRYPEIFEYLGWCSWDALQIRVSEEGLLEKCREFRDKNIPVKWAIIDDMWAEVNKFNDAVYNTRGEMFSLMHSSSMTDYEASYRRFPKGLAHAIDEIHSYGIRVGMWHPTTGYWMGLDPAGPAYRKLQPYTYTSPDGRIMSHWQEDKAFGFFNTMHRFFKECGADFLKVDNQSMTRRFYKYAGTVGNVTRQYHRGLEASVGLNFDNTMINCMGMASEDMWNRAYSPVSRCSDDFQPEDRPWFTKHILQCTYNSILQGEFYVNDYDMWWTDDTQAEKNSLLRAVSGGPIYVSDEIGRSRREILAPLAFDDGKILRCDRSGMPTADCLTVNPEASGKPLKIQNITGEWGVVAAFNITNDQKPVTGRVSPSDVPGLVGEKFVIYEYFTKHLWITPADGVEFTLNDLDDYRLFIIAPYVDGLAVIGRVDKFISPAAVTRRIGDRVTLYEDGDFLYVKDKMPVLLPKEDIDNHTVILDGVLGD